MAKPELTIKQILAWADQFHRRTGRWPTIKSVGVPGRPGETWKKIDRALRFGFRGLAGSSSLPRLLAQERSAPTRQRSPALREEQILQWADAFHQQTGRWPTIKSGGVASRPGETWARIDRALRFGIRGLPGGSSLPQFLAHERQARMLREEQILQWADAFHRRAGRWPARRSGSIANTKECWVNVDEALRSGARGLPGGSSLARLLAQQRGVRNRKQLPPLTEEQILAWADAHHQRTGQWPRAQSGPIPEAPGETWHAVQHALHLGSRGLRGGSSLYLLLAKKRGWSARHRPLLTEEQILQWADLFHAHTGRWPVRGSGPIPKSAGETWSAVDTALYAGTRGLPGGDTLVRLLARGRGRRNQGALPPLSCRQILAWADAHFRRTGTWPGKSSGPVLDAPGESWNSVGQSLALGLRGLPGGSSLARLLQQKRGVRNPSNLPPLTEEQLTEWARKHYQQMGSWPKQQSGPVLGAAGETWSAVNAALRVGCRGLSGGSSLAKLLQPLKRKR